MADPRNLPVRRIVEVPAPGAGNEVSISPNTSGLWLVRSLRFLLTTSAVVANRVVRLTVDNGSIEFFRSASPSAVVATSAVVHAVFDGTNAEPTSGDTVHLPWPTSGLVLPQGYRLQTLTDALDAGDAFTGVTLFVDDFPTGPGFMLRPFVPTIMEESS